MDIREQLSQKKRIVIKIGSSSLAHKETGSLDLIKLEILVREISDLKNQGKDVVLVSSGAIMVGKHTLGFTDRPKKKSEKQACASVGQARLMMIYQKLFMEYNQTAGQVLITKNTMVNDLNRFNAKNTFCELMSLGVIPIVNENDTVSTSELEGDRIGDNDTLSAMVSGLTKADVLLILSDVEGLCDSNPSKNPQARLITYIDQLNEEIYDLAEDSKTEFGTGGMITKLNAAKLAAQRSIPTVLASSENVGNIYEILEGKEIGTYISKNCLQNR